MTYARIYKESKSATQSGKSKYKWVCYLDSSKIALYFNTRESAITYAEQCGHTIDIIKENTPITIPKQYKSKLLYGTRIPR